MFTLFNIKHIKFLGALLITIFVISSCDGINLQDILGEDEVTQVSHDDTPEEDNKILDNDKGNANNAQGKLDEKSWMYKQEIDELSEKIDQINQDNNVEQEEVEELKILVDTNKDKFRVAHDANGKTPLMYVIDENSLEILNAYLDGIGDVEAEIIKRVPSTSLLDQKRLPNFDALTTFDYHVISAFEYAVAMHFTDIAFVMLEHLPNKARTAFPETAGVNPNVSVYPTIIAARWGNLDAMKRLIETYGLGPDEQKTYSSHSALGFTVSALSYYTPQDKNIYSDTDRYANYEAVLAYLLSKGADVDAVGNTNWTSLHSAVKYGYTSIVQKLIDAGANLELINNYHEHPVQTAINNKQFTLLQMLIDAGASTSGIKSVEAISHTAHKDMLRYIFNELGVDPASVAVDIYGFVRDQDTELLELFLGAGVSTEIKKQVWVTSDTRTLEISPLQYAELYDKPISAEVLYRYNADPFYNDNPTGNSILGRALGKQDRDKIRRLVAINPAAVTSNYLLAILNDASWISLAVGDGRFISDMLIFRGSGELSSRPSADEIVATKEKLKSVWTSLEHLLEALRDNGVDTRAWVNTKLSDGSGRSILHLFAMRSLDIPVEILVNEGADINVVDNYGNSIIDAVEHSADYFGPLRDRAGEIISLFTGEGIPWKDISIFGDKNRTIRLLGGVPAPTVEEILVQSVFENTVQDDCDTFGDDGNWLKLTISFKPDGTVYLIDALNLRTSTAGTAINNVCPNNWLYKDIVSREEHILKAIGDSGQGTYTVNGNVITITEGGTTAELTFDPARNIFIPNTTVGRFNATDAFSPLRSRTE